MTSALDPSARLFKIHDRVVWETATDVVPWAAVDLEDGFVHLSTAHQVKETARRHFAERDDLVLIEILQEHLPPDTLRWEASRGGDLFPHVYGDIPIDAVRRTAGFSMRAGATFPNRLLAP